MTPISYRRPIIETEKDSIAYCTPLIVSRLSIHYQFGIDLDIRLHYSVI